MNRADAARIGGMDRQTLRDWVHRFNEAGPDGLLDNWSKGRAASVGGAASRTRGDRRSWPQQRGRRRRALRRFDLKRVIKERFGVIITNAMSERC